MPTGMTREAAKPLPSREGSPSFHPAFLRRVSQPFLAAAERSAFKCEAEASPPLRPPLCAVG